MHRPAGFGTIPTTPILREAPVHTVFSSHPLLQGASVWPIRTISKTRPSRPAVPFPQATKNQASNGPSLSKMEVNVFPDHNSFPQTGFVRLSSILAPLGPIPVSKSTWWAGVKSGRYPQPVKLGPRITAWRVEDIIGLLNGSGKLSSGERA